MGFSPCGARHGASSANLELLAVFLLGAITPPLPPLSLFLSPAALEAPSNARTLLSCEKNPGAQNPSFLPSAFAFLKNRRECRCC